MRRCVPAAKPFAQQSWKIEERQTMNDRENVPDIIVGQTVTALGTLRSLARVGIEAFTVTGSK